MTSARKEASSLDSENLFKVALTASGQELVIGYYRGSSFSPDEALNLAAWLVQLALAAGGDFEKYIDLCERLEGGLRNG